MVMHTSVIALDEATHREASAVGGKAANLARLAAQGLPVPLARVLTTGAFERFMAASGTNLLVDHLTSFPPDSDSLKAQTERIRSSILGHPLPADLAGELANAFIELSEEGHTIVVRSSATVEDTASSSFAGMLSSIPGVSSAEEMYAAVKRCWASAFSIRATLYALERGVDPSSVGVAVVLQRQIPSERSGLVFGRDPARREADVVIVEVIQGAGEDIVSGEVTPERYEFTPSDQHVTPVGHSGNVSISDRKLSEREVALLAGWARQAEDVFGTPQDIEWAYADGEFYLLQSRPLVFFDPDSMLFPEIAEHTVLLRGIGASPAVGSGEVVVLSREQVQILPRGAVVVVRRLTNDLAVHLRYASAVVADEGGATSHGANILREFGVACVLATGSATSVLADGDRVTVDGYRGVVFLGDLSLRPEEIDTTVQTRTQVFVSILVPEQAKPVAAHADGVSSLRNDYFLLQSGVHPAKMVRTGRGRELEDALMSGMLETSRLFPGKPVWYKTLDAPTDEFRRLDGGDEEPRERNPLLGWRGLGRELEEPQLFALELRAVRRALEAGAVNVAVKLPFVRFPEEYEEAKRVVRNAGMRPHDEVLLGISVETPGIAAQLHEICDLGVDFVSVGVSDLVMCVLALDRESERVARLFRPAHPAVLEVLAHIADVSHRHGLFLCACGESAHDEALLPELVAVGYDAVGVSLPYFAPVKRRLAEIERG
jgi:pyruvate, water dikinase